MLQTSLSQRTYWQKSLKFGRPAIEYRGDARNAETGINAIIVYVARKYRQLIFLQIANVMPCAEK